MNLETKASAWMYEDEPSYDGERWRENFNVTMSEAVAKLKSGSMKQPEPLFKMAKAAMNPPIIRTVELEALREIEELLSSHPDFADGETKVHYCVHKLRSTMVCMYVKAGEVEKLLNEARQAKALEASQSINKGERA